MWRCIKNYYPKAAKATINQVFLGGGGPVHTTDPFLNLMKTMGTLPTKYHIHTYKQSLFFWYQGWFLDLPLRIPSYRLLSDDPVSQKDTRGKENWSAMLTWIRWSHSHKCHAQEILPHTLTGDMKLEKICNLELPQQYSDKWGPGWSSRKSFPFIKQGGFQLTPNSSIHTNLVAALESPQKRDQGVVVI